MNRRGWLIAALVCAAPMSATRADAVDSLRAFSRDAKSGRAQFTQTVTSPDGAKTKTSSGSFEFMRPNRFRFDYAKPYPQQIVADGEKVWLYDPDLNQASSRRIDKALGTTPAALLAGGAIESDFELAAEPAAQGLDWVRATPKAKDGAFQSLKVGFRAGVLAAVEVLDSFGQRSLLQFSELQTNVSVPADRFKFVPPAGAEVLQQ
jgi:outer membrane lipoprotein carrier protein